MPAAIAIPAIIGAAGSVGTALIGSHAAGKAADAQTQAGLAALAQQKELYNQTRQDLMPYASMGQPAMQTLRGLMGYGADPMTAPLPGPPSHAPTAAELHEPGWSAPQQMGQPGSQNFSQQWQGPGPNPVVLPGSPGAQAQGAMVTLRAPDGSTKQVPQAQAAHYIGLGAVQVG